MEKAWRGLLLVIFCACGLSNRVVGFVIDQWAERSVSTNIVSNIMPSLSLHPYFSLSHGPVGKSILDTDPIRLKKAAEDSLRYIEKHQHSHGHVLRPLPFTRDFMSLKKVKETLRFIVDTIAGDEKHGRPYRICDSSFINKNFGFIKWDGDSTKAKRYGINLQRDSIYLTKYTVYKFKGSYTKKEKYCYALYGLKNERKVPNYTKQEIIAGALEKKACLKNIAQPLVWLTRDGLEEALMQGTIFVTMPDKKLRAFNVQRNNGFLYDKSLSSQAQKRYWYFREINHKNAQALFQRYDLRKEVVFAGDIRTIGVGKVVAISYKNVHTKKQEIKLGVIADTGCAFRNNLYQLDFFVGVSDSKKLLYKNIKKYPELVNAYILYKKTYHA